MPGIESLIPKTTETFTYIDKESPAHALNTLSDLREHISTDGPYDGVLTFSEGAALAAMLLIQSATQNPHEAPPFRVAVFLSGGVPASPAALACNKRQLLNHAANGVQIRIPTAHIWGRNDKEYPDFGPVLRELCDPEEQSVFVHEGGHEVPGVGDKIGLAGAVRCAKRAIARSQERQ